MAKEIEKKFLVDGTSWKKQTILKKVDIEQGYLHKHRACTVRVRLAGDQGYITVKGPRVDIECDEFEYEIPKADAVAMLAMCPAPHIKKVRHYIRDDKNQMWEVDVFKGINRGLTIAEIELTSKKQVVTLPTWIGEEVSHDRRYTNAYLSDHKIER